jgi:hypothetical protein
MRKGSPDRVSIDFRLAGTKTRGAIQDVMAEFAEDVRLKLIELAPSPAFRKLIESNAVTVRLTTDGADIAIRSDTPEGKILLIYHFGTMKRHPRGWEIPFPRPRYKSDGSGGTVNIPLMGVRGENGKPLFRKWVTHPAIPPRKFIDKAFRQVARKYNQRVKRAIEKALREAANA